MRVHFSFIIGAAALVATAAVLVSKLPEQSSDSQISTRQEAAMLNSPNAPIFRILRDEFPAQYEAYIEGEVALIKQRLPEETHKTRNYELGVKVYADAVRNRIEFIRYASLLSLERVVRAKIAISKHIVSTQPGMCGKSIEEGRRPTPLSLQAELGAGVLAAIVNGRRDPGPRALLKPNAERISEILAASGWHMSMLKLDEPVSEADQATGDRCRSYAMFLSKLLEVDDALRRDALIEFVVSEAENP